MSFLEERLGLRGRTAAIVGGGGGLGRACALELARAGVNLALVDRRQDLLTETTEETRRTGVDVITAVIDARDPRALGEFFDEVDVAHEGGIDILLNVVGGTFHQMFGDSSPRGWDALVSTNFTWLLHSIHRALPLLDKSGGGSIINLTSIEAHRAAPGFAVYGALKAAVTSFTRSLALELAPRGIRVNTIAPDFVPTEGMQGATRLSSAAGEEIAIRARTPAGRLGTGSDVGGVALFLASDLSAFVTGTSLHPDGGALAAAGWQNWGAEGFRLNAPEAVLRDTADEPR